jgi:hypothetical protein
LPNVREAGVTVRSETFATPIALKETTIGESGALLLTIILPLAEPEAAAVKVVTTVALSPADKLIGSAIVLIAKPVPATETPETVNVSVPPFVIVRFCDALAPTVIDPKLIDEGFTSMERVLVPPVVPVVPGLPARPTQPEVATMVDMTVSIATEWKAVTNENRRDRKTFLNAMCSKMKWVS